MKTAEKKDKKRGEGKAVLITGASSGIGAATARLLAERGYGVALLARREESLEALRGEIAAAGGRALVVAGDVGVPGDVERAVERTVAHFGRLDALVNNAGFGLYKPLLETEPAELEAIFRTNVFGVLNGVRAAAPHLGRGSVIVTVSSLIAYVALPGWGAYAASKFALRAVQDVLREELKPRGVAMVTVNPGPVRTAFFEVAGKGGAAGSASSSPERVARAILRSLERPRRNVHIPRVRGGLSVVLAALAPNVLRRLVAATGSGPR